MFSFAAENHDLLDADEKLTTFGRFHRKPESICILPGLEPVFKRFVKAVENLISKPINSQQNHSSLEKAKSIETVIKNTKQKITSLEKTVETLESRMKNWIDEKLEKSPETSNTDDLTSKFSFNVTENSQIKFQCKHLGCSEIFILVQSPAGHFNLSNIQRHILKSCWLSPKSKRQNSCVQEDSGEKLKDKQKKIQTSLLSLPPQNKNPTRTKVHFNVQDNGSKSKDPTEPPQSKIAKTDSDTIDLTNKPDSIQKNL